MRRRDRCQRAAAARRHKRQHGSFSAVLDLDVKGRQGPAYRYKLLPVFSNLLPGIPQWRCSSTGPLAYQAKLEETLAVTEGLLYAAATSRHIRPVLLDGLMAQKNAKSRSRSGFRWGTALLPGQAITVEHLMDQDGDNILCHGQRAHRRDHQDDPRRRRRHLFNPDPYYQQGGDMVRVGGLRYAIDPARRSAAASRG